MKEEEKGKTPVVSTYNKDDKHFWAAFLNLARHNVYITVNHINKILGEAEINIDGYDISLKNIWSGIRDINKKARLEELMIKHFPFLETAIYTKNKEDKKEVKEEKQAKIQSFEILKDNLFLLLKMLQDLRNHYSHYKHSKSLERPKFDEDIRNKLYNIFDTSIRLVKEDYKHNPDIKPKEHFKHLDRKRNEKFRYSFADNEGNITISGLLFFVSLFLEKKDAIWVQKKLEGFRCSNESYQKMTNEVFCRNRILMPKLRLESTQTQDWILLDMLNELIRCPKSLYERLKGEDRKKFEVPFDSTDEDYDAEQDPFKNTLIRDQDRFPYFVLRYFDYNEIFENLRFQIDLGTYHFSIYKKLIGGQKEDRHLTHKLYGFERLQEFAKQNRPDEWKAIIKDLDTFKKQEDEKVNEKPYISETTPHYHLENEKIGIAFKNHNIWPTTNTEFTNNKRKKYNLGTSIKAEAFLSVHELLPMMFYYMLLKIKNEGPRKVEAIIESKIKDIFTLYDAFANDEIDNTDELEKYCEDKDIKIGHLPKQMIAILYNKHKDMVEKAKVKQEKMKLATENRLKTLDKLIEGKMKYAKRGISPLKSGEIASWLVNDMMRFQPVQRDENGEPLNNSKANSTEYQLLQRTLALFGSEHKRLTPYFKQMNLIGDNNSHPFLKQTEWEECNNILSFYRSYLEARKNFLKNLEPKDWKKNQYFLKIKEPKSNRQTLVQGWKNGFNLPRGIFTEPIKKWFIEHRKKMKVDELKSVGLVAKVIPLYFNEKYKDSVQPFYNYPFNVGDINKPKEKDFLDNGKRRKLWDKKQLEFKGKTEEEKRKNPSYLDFKSWKKFERELRLIRNQDIVTWLMCIELYNNQKVENLNTGHIYLKDIITNVKEERNNNILNQIKSMQLPVTVYENESSPKKKYLRTIYIEENGTKLLKQGNFKALVKDRRLNGLFSFVKTSSEAESKRNPISKLRVEHELREYQKARIDIIKDMLALEKTLIDNYDSLDTDNFHNMLTGWLELKGEAIKTKFNNDVKLLTAVRNAFSHNQYPMYDENLFINIERFSLSSSRILESKGLGIAVKLKEEVSNAIEKIKNEEDAKKET